MKIVVQEVILPAVATAHVSAAVPEEAAARGKQLRKLSSTSCPGEELLVVKALAAQQRTLSSSNVLRSEELRMRKFSLTSGGAVDLRAQGRHNSSSQQQHGQQQQSSSVESVRKSSSSVSGSRAEIRQRQVISVSLSPV